MDEEVLSDGGNGRRIALLLETDGPGGAEYMLLHLAEELRRRGHRVLPVGPEDGSGWLGELLRERGFDTATFHLRRPVDPGCVLRLARLFRERRIEVVHTHEFCLTVYGGAAAALARIPHVSTMHGGRYYAGRWRRRVALRWALRRSRAAVAVSRATREDLVDTLGLDRDGVRVVPNGLAPRAGPGGKVRDELDVRDDEPLIVSVGSLYPVKGHAVLLDALAEVSERRPDLPWRLALAGRGEEEDRLRSRADRQGIADRVHLLGFREDVGSLLDAATIFALPSLSEGLPLALLEAMHAGTAVVASAVGGVPEAVTAGREALLVPPEEPEALARALTALLADGDLRRRLGSSARRRAGDRFTVEAMTDAYERLYGWEPTRRRVRREPERREGEAPAEIADPAFGRPIEVRDPVDGRPAPPRRPSETGAAHARGVRSAGGGGS